MTPATRTSEARRPFLIAGAVLVALAAAGLLLAWGPAREWLSGPRSGGAAAGGGHGGDSLGALVAELVEAARERRTVEGRLTGGFEYQALSGSLRGGAASSGRPDGWRILAAASRVQEAAGPLRSAEALHAVGLAHLVLDEVEAATGALEQACRAAPERPEFLSDYSAALIERAEASGEAEDIVRGLDVAADALTRNPRLAEARFNLALALEKMFLGSRAASAWEAYLVLDSDSRWSSEARERLGQLRRSRGGETWESVMERLRAAAARADAAALGRLVAAHTQSVREWIEEVLLGEWGAQVRAGRAADAAGVLGLAESLARSLFEVTGDAMALEAAGAIRSAAGLRRPGGRIEALARGHRSYRDALLAYRRSDVEAAAGLFLRAESDLAAGGSPFADWAVFYLAVCDYHRGDLEAASLRLDRLRAGAEAKGRLALAGRVEWMTGLVEVVGADFGRAPAHYERGIALFERTGEAENLAALHSLLADCLGELGNFAGGWRHYRQGLSLLERARSLQRIYTFHVTVASAALAQGFPRTALEFQGVAIETSRAWGNAIALGEASVWSARLRHRLGENRAALGDLDEAERCLARARDGALRARVEAEILATRGFLQRDQDPVAAAGTIGRALAYFESTGARLRLAELELERGRAFLSAGRDDEAERSFMAAVESFERSRAELGSGEQRITYFDLARDVFDELILLQLERREGLERALQLAEQARARQLKDNLLGAGAEPGASSAGSGAVAAGAPASRLRARLPEGTAVLYFTTLRDRLLVWVITRRSIEGFQPQLPLSVLADRIASFRAALGREGGEAEVDRTSAALRQDLIEPLRQAMAGAKTLVIVPDGPLNMLPFGALRDPATGRFLVEDFRIALAPSATLLRAGGALPPGPADVLVVGNPLFDRLRFGNLPELPAAGKEAARIAALYPVSATLIGPAATRRRFLEEAARRSIIHFAGHAIPNERHPELSALILSPEAEGADDGALFARDIAAQRFTHARLVILSACSTAGGRLTRSEGVLNLARPFLAAGVPAVVASLWDVEDRGSGELFVRFHERLRAGSSPIDALRSSQIELLSSEDRALRRPAVWAAFSLITTSPA